MNLIEVGEQYQHFMAKICTEVATDKEKHRKKNLALVAPLSKPENGRNTVAPVLLFLTFLFAETR